MRLLNALKFLSGARYPKSRKFSKLRFKQKIEISKFVFCGRVKCNIIICMHVNQDEAITIFVTTMKTLK